MVIEDEISNRCMCGHGLAKWMRLEGYDVIEVRDRDCRMSDEDILKWAVKEKRILITMDKDFNELITLLDRRHTGIIRLENEPNNIRIDHLKKILELHKKDLCERAIIIQKGSKIRIRKWIDEG